MLWLKRICIAFLIASMSLFLFAGCEAVAGYLLYDIISGGPIFGGDGGDDNDDNGGNHAPIIVTVQALPDAISIGGTVTVSVIASDEDDDDLTYLWQASKGQFSAPTSNVTLWTAPTDFTGVFQITVTVSDGNGGMDIDYVDVTVTL